MWIFILMFVVAIVAVVAYKKYEKAKYEDTVNQSIAELHKLSDRLDNTIEKVKQDEQIRRAQFEQAQKAKLINFQQNIFPCISSDERIQKVWSLWDMTLHSKENQLKKQDLSRFQAIPVLYRCSRARRAFCFRFIIRSLLCIFAKMLVQRF